MLLHNSNINVGIAHILVGQKRLYDHQGRSCKNHCGDKPSKMGVVKKGCGHEIENCRQVQFCS